jgi:hypothetical protein
VGIVAAAASGSGHWLAIAASLLVSTLLTLALAAFLFLDLPQGVSPFAPFVLLVLTTEPARWAIVRSPLVRSEQGTAIMAVSIWSRETAWRFWGHPNQTDTVGPPMLYASLVQLSAHYLAGAANFRAKGRTLGWAIAGFLVACGVRSAALAFSVVAEKDGAITWIAPPLALLLMVAVGLGPRFRRR